MSKQMELAPLRRGHLILQQAQLKKEAGRPQAASVRVGSAAGQLLQLSQNRWQSPINNQICRLQARPRTIWITQRTRWLSPPAHCEVAVATPSVPTLAIQPAPAAVPPVVRVDPITRYHQFRPVDQLAFHMRHINIDMMAVELPHVSAIRDATPSTGSTSTSTSMSTARVPAAMQYTRPSFKRVETVAEVENNVQRTNDEMDGSNWQHAVLNTTSSRTTTVTTYKRDRERADFQRESHVSNLSNMRSTGAHEPDLSLEASTATTGWSIRSTSRVAVQALQPHTPLLKKPLNAEEEEELTVARVTESHQDTRALQCNAASLGQDIFGRCSPQQVQSMAELQPPQVRQRKIVRKIFNTSVWNGQDDQGVDELTSILRCDEKV